MNKKKVIVLVLLIFGFFLLFKYSETQSILSVINQRNDAIRNATLRVLRNGEVVKTPLNQRRYLNGLYNIDTSHCPKKFQLAWLDYVQACERTRMMQGEMMFDAVVSLTTSSPAFIVKGISSSEKIGNDRELAWQNLERVALEYDVRFIHH
jgi:hypothetical protein